MASVAHGTQWVKDRTGLLGRRLPTWRPRDLGPLHNRYKRPFVVFGCHAHLDSLAHLGLLECLVWLMSLICLHNCYYHPHDLGKVNKKTQLSKMDKYITK
ncbi:hypothetical protein Scep_023746 [Stephania cephalantha]|uniref:Uncharacterized protein n=1 Tax=Stephania cephalantha TaxID=152367 RepID=A0AAP0EW97_9MAGN